ncbi:hypothetical protein Pcinc_042373 [Petrolisthes cinctipes]|uniref:Uncharacterized protein n=1 Tax=Petrolisthes cinctipes TaxID=88211 RepID=A0AAE1BLD7_PETCI|nr:hypothetical protein Pcinc_042373 [Petrolisthes cinctipes]
MNTWIVSQVPRSWLSSQYLMRRAPLLYSASTTERTKTAAEESRDIWGRLEGKNRGDDGPYIPAGFQSALCARVCCTSLLLQVC